MNRKGFTLIELLATIVVLAIIVGITIPMVNINTRKAKQKTEDVFVKTIKDAMEMYLDSEEVKKVDYNIFVCTIRKTLGNATLKKSNDIKLRDVINSEYSPLHEKDLVNPANEKEECNLDAKVSIYRDSDYVYYYKISRSSLTCLLDNDGYITSLPDECKNK